MAESLCRWGIVSTANIARKNWKAIQLSGNGTVAGVSSRSLDRANAFIDECQAEVPLVQRPTAFASHQELLESSAIDAVYVPLPTGLRKPVVLAAAEAGKHVLIEKPMAIDANDAREMADACAANGVQLMDGVMFDHGQRIGQIQQTVHSGKLGNVRRIQAHFSFCGDDDFRSGNIRTDAGLEPQGCVGDLGWYCIRFLLWMSGFESPLRVSGRMLKGLSRSNGSDQDTVVPGEFVGELEFSSGVTAGFFCSFQSANQQTVLISGDEAYLSVDDFVLPLYDSQMRFQTHRHELEIDNCRWNFRRRSSDHWFDEYHSGESNSQEVQMVRTFAEHVISGQLDPNLANRAVQTQAIMDACLKSASNDGAFIEL